MCKLTYRIIESKNAGFQEGDYVIANFGWRTHTISNGENVRKLDRNIFTDQKLSTALGVLGMPGYVLLCIQSYECCYVFLDSSPENFVFCCYVINHRILNIYINIPGRSYAFINILECLNHIYINIFLPS